MVLAGQDELVSVFHSGSSATVHLHGATLISWKHHGEEQLFLSKKAVLNGSKPIRGGIPVVFPQFGVGPLIKSSQQHGFARSMRWTVSERKENKVKLQLRSDEQTRLLYPFDFELHLAVTLEDNLSVEFSVHNLSAAPLEFTALLHTYFRVESIADISVGGLAGCVYRDKLRDSSKDVEASSEIKIAGEVDRVYLDAPTSLFIHAPKKTVKIASSNFPDAVLWNPWIEKSKAMADFDDEEYKEMVCLEVGHVGRSVILPASAQWTASQTLSIAG